MAGSHPVGHNEMVGAMSDRRRRGRAALPGASEVLRGEPETHVRFLDGERVAASSNSGGDEGPVGDVGRPPLPSEPAFNGMLKRVAGRKPLDGPDGSDAGEPSHALFDFMNRGAEFGLTSGDSLGCGGLGCRAFVDTHAEVGEGRDFGDCPLDQGSRGVATADAGFAGRECPICS